MHHNPIPGVAPDVAEDAIDQALLGLLIHRIGQFVFATRARHSAQRLLQAPSLALAH
jgi:hypothetical protein